MFKHSVTTKSRAIAHSNRDTPGASCVPFAMENTPFVDHFQAK
jgi:hypothetical protein